MLNLFASTKVALVILGGLNWDHPTPSIDTALRFNDLHACEVAKAALLADGQPGSAHEYSIGNLVLICVEGVN